MNYEKVRKLLWVILGVTLIIGLISFVFRVLGGLASTDLGSYVPWGLFIAGDIYFISMSAGAFLISSLVYVFGVKTLEPVGPLALFTALICLLASMLHVIFDLGHIERFWYMLASPNLGSLLNYIVWAYAVYMLLMIVELFLAIRGRLWAKAKRVYTPGMEAKDKRIVKILAILGIPLAISFHGGVGAMFGVLIARPYWHGGLYPILFLIAALAAGGAFMTFVIAFFNSKKGESSNLLRFIARLSLGILIFENLYLLAEYFLVLYQGAPDDVQAVMWVFTGPYSWAFWSIQLILGTLVPIIILSHPRLIRKTNWVGAAGLLIVIGFFVTRLNIILPALATSTSENEAFLSAFDGARLTLNYTPTLTEWGVVIGAISLAAILFLVGYERLPLIDKTHSEVADR